jgi:hypothetical protein
MQRKGETLHSYIQRWSIIKKNFAEDVSDERAVDAFSAGLRRSGLMEELGRTRPKTVLELRNFYLRALGSLVVLSFPQPLSFSSVLPKPLSEILTRSSDGRNPV